jgi:hypothetical protein
MCVLVVGAVIVADIPIFTPRSKTGPAFTENRLKKIAYSMETSSVATAIQGILKLEPMFVPLPE